MKPILLDGDVGSSHTMNSGDGPALCLTLFGARSYGHTVTVSCRQTLARFIDSESMSLA